MATTISIYVHALEDLLVHTSYDNIVYFIKLIK